jgi:hypothetical protein
MNRGVLSKGVWLREAELFLGVPVAVTDPEPGVAVPVEVPPAFWDPAPVRPKPFPAAPVFIKAAAPEGMAGRESPVTSQLADLAGQLDAPPVALYPPFPDGFEVPAKAVFRAA